MNDNLETVVILERVTDTATDYWVHGRVKCITCGHWCWLGSNTLDLVSRGLALPLCQQCARLLIPPGHPVTGNAGDERRTDGERP